MQTTLHRFQIKINCNQFRYTAPCQTLYFRVTWITNVKENICYQIIYNYVHIGIQN